MCDENNMKYIKSVLFERELELQYTKFIKNNPNLETDIVYRDDRLKLISANNDTLCFKFEGIKDSVILNKNGVSIGDNTWLASPGATPLNDAVFSIQQNNNVEQILKKPHGKVIKVDGFSL